MEAEKVVVSVVMPAYNEEKYIEAFFHMDLRGMCNMQSELRALKCVVIEAIQPITSNGFEADTEIVVKTQKKGYKIRYVTITYTYERESKVNIFSDSFKTSLPILRWKMNGKLEGFAK